MTCSRAAAIVRPGAELLVEHDLFRKHRSTLFGIMLESARWMERPMIHEYAAIDPMALLFPSRLYIELSEKLHPHVPKSIEIKEALGRLTPEERKYILVRARMLSTYSKAVEEAIGSMK